ncbi:MAG: hypothetical protein G01um101430_396 [Parcubacteria group bacterium Gr01-1014_30]|nr:MAG: hypothetical protein G01um101430_396 [Parcubacteria group bacterium Gr01-1014_30]
MIPLKTPEEIKIMAEGGRILAGIMKELVGEVGLGVVTKNLEEKAQDLISKAGAKSNFLGYDGFPSCLCASVNDEIVHCAPSDRLLKEGDIVSIDLGILWQGFHADMAITMPIGKVSAEAARLIRVAKKSLKRGIKKAKVGNTFGDVGNTIQRYVESQGFGVVRELTGHGIGRELHEEPKVLNYGKRREGEKIKEGMVFCIEPMITAGDWKLKKTDNHCFATEDGSLSAHFEHMVAITKNGPLVLTNL